MLCSRERIKKLKEFLKSTNLKFKDLNLLNRAFCHTSYIYENNIERLESYERLEFLGDAVLKLSVSDILYSKYSDKNEGELSEQRSFIVADKTIAEFAQKINMQDYILTGKCEKKGLKSRETILACAFEALLGALYLDNKDKGYKAAKEFLVKNFTDDILKVDYSNPKAELQELTQKYNHNLPNYVLLDEKGPAHDKTFTVGVYYENELVGEGSAKMKKEAEFEAAKRALVILKNKYGENKNV